MNSNRSRQVNAGGEGVSSGPIVYWMSRDQRVRDNWALIYAQKEAIKRKVPLVVLFCFVPNFLQGTLRQYGFMLRGLPSVERGLRKRGIPFFFLSGEPKDVIPDFLHKIKAGALFVDFSPLYTKKQWLADVARAINLPIYEVDAHNIVPCWKLFSRRAKSTEAFRVKLRNTLPLFLNAFPAVRKHPIPFRGKTTCVVWDALLKVLPLDTTVPEVLWAKSGEEHAQKAFRAFLKQRVHEYKSGQVYSDAQEEWQWRLQPYLHFGQLSIQRIIWAVMHSEIDARFKADFLDALITRRELADHFCLYEEHYDSVQGFALWAQKTLKAHQKDTRTFSYSQSVIEQGKTHDEFWNILQRNLVKNGIIFGYARLYWAKKILEWSPSPEEALRIAIALSEKYSLSGWDTSNYFNIAKAMGGVYERPAKKPIPIFGRVSRMRSNNSDARRDLKTYADKV